MKKLTSIEEAVSVCVYVYLAVPCALFIRTGQNNVLFFGISRQPHSIFRRILSPFPEHEVCYVSQKINTMAEDHPHAKRLTTSLL